MFRGKTYESDKTVEMYQTMKIKRYRSAFTTEQITYLEVQYKKCPYIGSATRKEVANILGIPERAIKIWFQNRRMKEKKEINSKEYILYRQNNFMKSTGFTKDSLNDIHSSQSANDGQGSLELTAAKHVDEIDRTRTVNLTKAIEDNSKLHKFKNIGMTKNIKQKNERKTVLPNPPILPKYCSNKFYNNKDFIKYLEQNKNCIPKSKETAKKVKSSTVPRYPHQDLPEDLTAHKTNKVLPQNRQETINLSAAYIPFCNTQNMCLSAGNIIWKPVKVMPVVSSNILPSATVPETQQSINLNIHQKCKCNCNCHSSKELHYYKQGNMAPPPQYVVAIPYNTN